MIDSFNDNELTYKKTRTNFPYAFSGLQNGAFSYLGGPGLIASRHGRHCSPLKSNTSFILEKIRKRFPEHPEYAEMRHDDVILT